MYKILSVVGTRPHFTKAASVCRAIAETSELQEVMAHTGQHYDANLSDDFFKELDLPRPKYQLNVGSGKPAWQLATIVLKLDEVIEQEKPDAIIVYGDTNSTAAGAIAAAKNNVVLIHIEAGLREFDKTIPEEINKLITDSITDIFFSPTQTGVENLKKEGVTKNVYNVGDVAIDNIAFNMNRIESNTAILEKYKLQKEQYYFMTCHRACNTDSFENLHNIISAVAELDEKIIFSAHPRTQKAIKAFELTHLIENSKIEMIDPIGFWDTQTLVRNAKMVLTDSGGIIKEAYYHKTPGVILDKQTEWIETVEEGWNAIAGPNKEKILDLVNNHPIPTHHSDCVGNGQAAKRIVKITKEFLDARKQESTRLSTTHG